MSVGIELFILTFFTTTFLDSYLVNAGVTGDYMLGNYGLFGIIIFMAMLAFLIVRFKAFNIKLLGAQALMWAIGLLVGSQLFFIQTTTNFILTSITLIITVIAGYILVKSVKKVDEQREQLEIANQNQMVLVRFITHQVKGFFTKSKMIFAGLLEGDFGQTTDQIKDVAKTGLDSDNSAVAMISEILNASSLKTGQTSFNFENVNFGDFVHEIADSFKSRATEKGLNYEITISERPLLARIDKMQMTQVIKNLIDNAINYTPSGKVIVEVKEHHHDRFDEVHFAVTDSGIGLTEKDKLVLFREGGRGEESVKTNVNSTGYGLFIVKKIVDGHNGIISATSEGRGKGTTFNVELPEVVNNKKS